MKIFLVMSLCAIASCAAAAWVEIYTEPTKGGVIKYFNQGSDSAIADRRDDATRKIKGFCADGYRVIKEIAEFSSRMESVGENRDVTKSIPDEYVYIHFECKS